MDWWKLLAFLVAVTSIEITAEVPAKKIRIHLPQKVRHIHHHKKIYITNHPASSQYAPAYSSGPETAAAMTSNVISPVLPDQAPFDSVEPYEEDSRVRHQSYKIASSKMVPLYRARGYYGPNPTEWDEEDEYDINNSAEPVDPFRTTGIVSSPLSISSNQFPKKAKVGKQKELTRKKVFRKNKPKQILIKGKPVQEEEHPVSTFHEEFYSDLHGTGTIKKIKKPQRVEKIIDGDTEHVHTYSEEHIHKIVFDDGAKITGMPTDDTSSGIPVFSSAKPIVHIKNAHSLLALPSNPFTGFSYPPIETPANLEYVAYNPHEVTHDHIFHDHGEIPPDVDVTKDPLLYPPRFSYNSKGVRIGVRPTDTNLKLPNNYINPTKATPMIDFNYPENIPYQYAKTKNHYKNTKTQYDTVPQKIYDEFKPITYENFREKMNLKGNNLFASTHYDSERTQHTSAPTPFAVSSTIIYDYTPKIHSERVTAPSEYSKFKDPLVNFKDSYSSNLEYDTYAASSNFYPTAEKNYDAISPFRNLNRKQKSVSKQSINFLNLDHKTRVDHPEFQDSGPGLELNHQYEAKSPEHITPTPNLIKDTSPGYSYYSAMAIKALHETHDQEDGQIASTTSYTSPLTFTTLPTSEYYDMLDTITTPSPNYLRRQRPKSKSSKNKRLQHEVRKQNEKSQITERNVKTDQGTKYFHQQSIESSNPLNRFKYGDKLN